MTTVINIHKESVMRHVMVTRGHVSLTHTHTHTLFQIQCFIVQSLRAAARFTYSLKMNFWSIFLHSSYLPRSRASFSDATPPLMMTSLLLSLLWYSEGTHPLIPCEKHTHITHTVQRIRPNIHSSAEIGQQPHTIRNTHCCIHSSAGK